MVNKKLTGIFLLFAVLVMAMTLVTAADTSDASATVADDSSSATIDTSSNAHTDTAQSSDVQSSSSSADTSSSNVQTSSSIEKTSTHSSDTTAKASDSSTTAKASSSSSQSSDTTAKADSSSSQSSDTTAKATSTSSQTTTSDIKNTNDNIQSVNTSTVDSKTDLKSAIEADDYTNLLSDFDSLKRENEDTEVTIELNPESPDGAFTVSQSLVWGDTNVYAQVLTIDGSGQTIYGDGNHFLTIEEGYTVILTDMTITGCYDETGGAILNHGTLILENVIFKDNSAERGAAILNVGDLTIEGSTFESNTVTASGGAIYNSEDGTVTISGSEFEENSANSNGGAIASAGTIEIDSTEFLDNTATDGGAIRLADGDLTITSSTFTSNTATNYGGAIEAYTTKTPGTLIITGSTFTENKASHGGAIDNSIETSISSSTFEGNEATVNGGAISNDGDLTLTGNEFRNNTSPLVEEETISSEVTFEDSDNEIYLNDKFCGDDPIELIVPVVDTAFAGKEVTFNIYDETRTLIDTQTTTFESDGTAKIEYTFDEQHTYYVEMIINNDDEQVGITIYQTIHPLGLTVTVNENQPLYGGQEYTITGTLFEDEDTPMSDEEVTIQITDSEGTVIYETTVTTGEDGHYTTDTLTAPEAGTYNVKAYLVSDPDVTAETTLEVISIGTKIEFNDLPATYYPGDDIEFTGTLYAIDENGEITGVLDSQTIQIYIDGVEFVSNELIVTDENGVFTVKITPEDDIYDTISEHGTSIVKAEFAGDSHYAYSEAYEYFDFKFIETSFEITAIPDPATVGESVEITVTLKDEDGNPIVGQPITVTIDGTTYHVTSTEEGYTYNFETTQSGTITIVASYEGNEKYLSTADETEFTVVKADSGIRFTTESEWLIEGTVTKETPITGILTGNGNGIADAEVVLYVDGQAVATTTTKEDGSFEFDYISDVVLEDSRVYVAFEGNDEFEPCETNTAVLEIDKIGTILNFDEPSEFEEPLYNNFTITGTLFTEFNEPLTGETVTITIKDEEGNVITDSLTAVVEEDGSFSVDIKDIDGINNKVGTYYVTASYAGTDIYQEAESGDEIWFDVEALSTKLVIEAATDDVKVTSTVEITGKLTDYYGDDIADATVDIYANGVKVGEATTDSEGTFTYNYVADTLGEVTITASYEGQENVYVRTDSNELTFTVEKLGTYIVPDLPYVAVVGDQLDIKATLYDENDNPIPHEYIDVYVDGKYVYSGYTDDYGRFEYFIPADEVKDGEITLEFDSSKSVNGIYDSSSSTEPYIIEPIGETLTVDPISNVAINESVTITGTLLDEYGEGITGTVTITVGDAIYTDVPVLNGNYSYTIEEGLAATGTYTVVVNYAGDDTHASAVDGTTFDVEKIGTEITVRTELATENEETTITGKLVDEFGRPIENAEVTITVDGTVIGTPETNENGEYTITFIPEHSGYFTVEATFGETDVYLGSDDTTRLTVNKMETTITIDTDKLQNVYPTDSVDVTITLTDDEGNKLPNKEVTIEINGDTHVVTTNENGQATVTIKAEETTYTINAKFDGDDDYLGSEDSYTFTVEKLGTEIIPDTNFIVTEVGQDLEIKGRLVDANEDGVANQYVDVLMDGEYIFSLYTDENGEFGTSIPTNTIKSGTITYEYKGDESGRYSAAENKEVDYEIEGISTTLTVDVENTPLNSPIEITGTLVDEYGNGVNGFVTITIGDAIYTDVPVLNGNYSYTIEEGLADIDTYEVKVTYAGDDKYLGTETTGYFDIERLVTTLTIDDIADQKVGNNITITGKLVDENGNPVADATITLNINEDTELTVTTEADGTFSQEFTVPVAGLNTIDASFAATDIYTGANAHAEFNAEKIGTKIEADPIIVADAGDNLVVKGTLLDENNNVLGDQVVEIYMDGTLYTTVTTEDDGTFEVDIPTTKEEAGEITIKYSGDATYEAAADVTVDYEVDAIATTLTIDDIENVEVGQPVTITGSLVDEEGTPLDGTVTLTIGDLIEEVDVTDGKFSYTIEEGLAAVGTYDVKVSYAGNDIYYGSMDSTTFDVEPISTKISVETELATVGKETTISGQLTTLDGTALAGNIIVKVDGVEVYNGPTNDDGTYSISYTPENAGEFTVEVEYAGSENYADSSNVTRLTVNKVDTILTVDTSAIEGALPTDVVDLTAKLVDEDGTPIAGETVTFEINGVTYTAETDSNGVATIPYTVVEGDNIVQATYAGSNDYYGSESDESTVTVEKLGTELSIENIADQVPGSSVTVTGVLTDVNGNKLSNKEVVVIVNSADGTSTEYKVTTADDGSYLYTIDDLVEGSYSVVAVFNGDDQYENSYSTIVSFDVSKAKDTVVIDPIADAKIGDEITIKATVTDAENNPVDGDVTVTINGVDYPATATAGVVEYPYTVTTEGVNSVTVTYNGDGTHASASDSTTFTASKVETQITIDPIADAKVGDQITVTGTLEDTEGNPVDGDVIVTINGVDYPATATDGEFEVPYTVTTEGTNSVTVTYNGDDKYTSASDSTTFTSSKTETELTVDPIADANVGDNVTVSGTLTDTEGNPIANQNVTINVNGNTTTVPTDNNGNYNYNYTVTKDGTNNVTVTYNGDDKYTSSTKTDTFRSSKVNATVTVNPVADSTVGDRVTITGTLEDTNGKAIANTNVTVTINGVNYTVRTDSNGDYSVNYTTTTAGVNNVTVSYPGDDKYTAATANTTFNVANQTPSKLETTITVADATGKYNNSVNLTATVLDENGNRVTDGQVAFKINGVTLTDENGEVIYVDVVNGVARLNYTLSNNPKEYSITGLYYGSDKYYTSKSTDATLTITNRNATVTVNNLPSNIRSGDTIQLTAIVTEDGKFVDSGVVIFKINGVTLKDENGDAIQVDVVNGVATLNYTIPMGYSAKDYNVTAVYSNKNYDRAEGYNTLSIIKSNVTAQLTPITINQGEDASLYVVLYDQNGNQLERSTKVSIKINGKTIINTTTSENGVLNVTLPTSDFKNSYYNLTVVFGENSAYNELRLNSTIHVVSGTSNANAIATTNAFVTTSDSLTDTFVANDLSLDLLNTAQSDNGTMTVEE